MHATSLNCRGTKTNHQHQTVNSLNSIYSLPTGSLKMPAYRTELGKSTIQFICCNVWNLTLRGKGGSKVIFEILRYVLHLPFYLHILFTELSCRAPRKSYGVFAEWRTTKYIAISIHFEKKLIFNLDFGKKNSGVSIFVLKPYFLVYLLLIDFSWNVIRQFS